MGKLFTNLQFGCFVTIAKQVVVSNFHKTTRQYMNKKSADKLLGGKRHNLMLTEELEYKDSRSFFYDTVWRYLDFLNYFYYRWRG